MEDKTESKKEDGEELAREYVKLYCKSAEESLNFKD